MTTQERLAQLEGQITVLKTQLRAAQLVRAAPPMGKAPAAATVAHAGQRMARQAFLAAVSQEQARTNDPATVVQARVASAQPELYAAYCKSFDDHTSVSARLNGGEA